MRPFFLFLALFFLPNTSSHAATPVVATQALADKSDHIVVFYDDAQNEILRVHAVFGQGKGPKKREGDLKTPEGDYTLYPGRPSTEWEWFMPIDYPNEYDIARAKAEGQPLNTLGNKIGIHSAGDGWFHGIKQSFSNNWTWGCIAISADDMDRVRAIMTEPIPIHIQP